MEQCNCNRKHPLVIVDLDVLVLRVQGAYEYEINLEQIRNADGLVNCLYQLNKKVWMTHELMGEIVQAFYCACRQVFNADAQGLFAHDGTHKDWSAAKARRFGG